MVTATQNGSIPEAQTIPEVAREAMQSALVLPEGGHTIHIKMAKKHPLADVISALGHCVLVFVTGAITYLFAKRQIDEGSAFAPIQAALNIITAMNAKG